MTKKEKAKFLKKTNAKFDVARGAWSLNLGIFLFLEESVLDKWDYKQLKKLLSSMFVRGVQKELKNL